MAEFVAWSYAGRLLARSAAYRLVIERHAQLIEAGIDGAVDATRAARLVNIADSRTTPRWNLPLLLAQPAAVSRVRTRAVSDPGLVVALADAETVADTAPHLLVVDSAQAARLHSERWVKLIKRVDAAPCHCFSAMSLLQRVALAARRTATSPTHPPARPETSSCRPPAVFAPRLPPFA